MPTRTITEISKTLLMIMVAEHDRLASEYVHSPQDFAKQFEAKYSEDRRRLFFQVLNDIDDGKLHVNDLVRATLVESEGKRVVKYRVHGKSASWEMYCERQLMKQERG